MPYHVGSGNFVGNALKKALITESKILTTALDMNFRNITSVKDPVLNQDAATKLYVDGKLEQVVDDVASKFTGIEVTLYGISFTQVAFIKTGSYIVTIHSENEGYPTATYSISKSSEYTAGMINRISSNPGLITSEQLDLQWPVGDYLVLRKTGPGFNGVYIVDFNVKNMSSVSGPVINPTDAATKAYVDNAIRQQLDVKFAGITVNLIGTNYVDIINLRTGSYIMTVTPINLDSAPTGSFSISKNTVSGRGHVVKITGLKGLYTEEQLELVWLENSLIQLRKSGPGYDGNYLVDLSLKNFSSYALPPIPTDTATIQYVDQKIEEIFQARFGGVIVTLSGLNYSTISNLNFRPGSYIIAVTPMVIGGASATFAISKNTPYMDAQVNRTSSVGGIDTGEELEIQWLNNSLISIRKTSIFHDGDYIIDFNLKNITPELSLPLIPTDQASKWYVDHSIEEKMDVKFGGIEVNLIDTDFSQIGAFRAGTYLVSISGTEDGFPTAGFFISKSSVSAGNPDIVKLTSSVGADISDTLELSWPSESQLLLRKTTSFHDGLYIVDMNLRNFTSVPTAVFPTDTATRSYVNQQIDAKMKADFEGFLVNLNDTDFSDITDLKIGSYFVTVSPQMEGGPSANFSICKSSQDTIAVIDRIVSSPGINTIEELELSWNSNSKLKLCKNGIFYNGDYLVDFNLKNFSSIPAPLIPSDSATKGFVENLIQEEMQIKFKGVTVNLINDTITNVAPVKCGSYIVSVSSTIVGAANALFYISKSKQDTPGTIIRQISTPGIDTLEEINLYWDVNKQLQICKTNVFRDGLYIIDFNLKDFSDIPIEPIVPGDIASKEYVDNSIQVKYQGILVNLIDDNISEVVALRAGSYEVSISCQSLVGAPSAFFLISKTKQDSQATILKQISTLGDHGEDLFLMWNANEKLKLRKSTIFSDGMYLVDFNLKNFSDIPTEIILPSDAASKEYVDSTFNKKFQGVLVELIDDNISNVVPLSPGSYIISISCPSAVGSPTALFYASKNKQDSVATIIRNISSPGDNGEQLYLFWEPNRKLTMKKDSPFSDGMYLVNFNMQNFSDIPIEVVLPTDIASKEFVETTIQNEMQFKFGGQFVELIGIDFVDVYPLKTGTYFITISSLLDNAPTASFIISKNSLLSNGSINRLTSNPGYSSGEELELQWLSNKKLQIHKTGVFYDAMYLVDINLRNITDATDTLLPSDLASKSYVDNLVNEKFQTFFNGTIVELSGTSFSNVIALKAGSYTVNISSVVDGGPSGSFSISKSSVTTDTSVVNLTSCPAINDPSNLLSLTWPPNSQVLLKKTSSGFDGQYLVDFNLKNISTVPITNQIPNDTASIAYVNEQIREISSGTVKQYQFTLTGINPVLVAFVTNGTYLVFLSSANFNATFSISKFDNINPGSISTMSMESSDIDIDITWRSDGAILIYKNSTMYDGSFILKVI